MEGELNQITPSVCRLSKGSISYILGTIWCIKLKLTGLVVGDVELHERQYLYPNTTSSTHTTSTDANTAATTKTEGQKITKYLRIIVGEVTDSPKKGVILT